MLFAVLVYVVYATLSQRVTTFDTLFCLLLVCFVPAADLFRFVFCEMHGVVFSLALS